MLSKRVVYSYSRMLHAYLSAFAFIALIFFALTGLFLNNPQWFKKNKSSPQEHTITLTPQELSTALNSKIPTEELAIIIKHRTTLHGLFKSGEIIEHEALIHFEGVKGKSNIIIDLQNGLTEITTESASPLAIIQNLHRGKNSGKVWKVIIDITAYLTLSLSLIGYILFFILRFRLIPSLTLTAVSLIIMGAVFLFLVP